MALKHAVLFVLLAVVCCEAALTIRRRSLDSNASANASSERTNLEVCEGRTPCGWAVYNRLTRYIEYFMKNKCVCLKDQKCKRDDDDISITAYVYRCKIDDNPKST